jgi:hypothetical protein
MWTGTAVNLSFKNYDIPICVKLGVGFTCGIGIVLLLILFRIRIWIGIKIKIRIRIGVKMMPNPSTARNVRYMAGILKVVLKLSFILSFVSENESLVTDPDPSKMWIH